MLEPADVGVTIIWPSMVNRRPSRRPKTHPQRQLRSSLGDESRGDDESDARPKRRQ
jgi:hypothetical protein